MARILSKHQILSMTLLNILISKYLIPFKSDLPQVTKEVAQIVYILPSPGAAVLRLLVNAGEP